MKKFNIKRLALISVLMPCLFYWGVFIENIFEPFIGALIFTVIYLLLLCGRAPRVFRAIACFTMSWILFLFARRLNLEMIEFTVPLRELDADLPLVQAKYVFGCQTQGIISIVVAAVAYLVGKNKFITVEE